MSRFFQTLESRTLLSAAVHETHGGDSSKLAEDRAQYLADIEQYKKDAATMTTTLAADRAKVSADQKAVCESKKAAKTQFQTDQTAFINELKENSAKGKPIVEKWKPVLEADKAAIMADGEHGEHLADDKAKLEADYKAFRTDMQSIEDGTKTIMAKWKPILAADKEAMEGRGDSDLVAQFKADKEQLAKDEKFFKKLLCEDQKKITADAKKMKKDGGGDKGEKKTQPEHKTEHATTK